MEDVKTKFQALFYRVFSEENLEALRSKLNVGNRTLPLMLMVAVVMYLAVMGAISGLTTYGNVLSYVQLTASTTSGHKQIMDQLESAPVTGPATVSYGGLTMTLDASTHATTSYMQQRSLVLAEYAALLYHVGGPGNVGRAYSVLGDRAHDMYTLLWWLGLVLLAFVFVVMLANYEPWQAVAKSGYALAAGGAASAIIGILMLNILAPQLDTTSRTLIEAYPVVVSGVQWSFITNALKYIVVGALVLGFGKVMGSDGPGHADRSEE